MKAAAQTFRPNPDFDTETAITELGTGEALVSTLDAKGAPTVVQRTLIRPPMLAARARVGGGARRRAGEKPRVDEVRHARSTASRPTRS